MTQKEHASRCEVVTSFAGWKLGARGKPEGGRKDISCFSTRTCSHARFCGVDISFVIKDSKVSHLQCIFQGKKISGPQENLLRIVTEDFREYALSYLAELKHSGKVFQYYTGNTQSNSFTRDGRYFSVEDWVFAMRSRVEGLPTPANLQRWNRKSPYFCNCGTTKALTMCHFLNNCPRNMGLFKKRHDCVVNRMASELRKHKHYTKWKIYEDSSLVSRQFRTEGKLERPDIVMIAPNKDAVILEVTVSHADSHSQSLESSYESKLQKYAQWKEELLMADIARSVEIYPIVLGSTGLWNFKSLNHMRKVFSSNKYYKNMFNFISIDVVRHSAYIWRQSQRRLSQSMDLPEDDYLSM